MPGPRRKVPHRCTHSKLFRSLLPSLVLKFPLLDTALPLAPKSKTNKQTKNGNSLGAFISYPIYSFAVEIGLALVETRKADTESWFSLTTSKTSVSPMEDEGVLFISSKFSSTSNSITHLFIKYLLKMYIRHFITCQIYVESKLHIQG